MQTLRYACEITLGKGQTEWRCSMRAVFFAAYPMKRRRHDAGSLFKMGRWAVTYTRDSSSAQYVIIVFETIFIQSSWVKRNYHEFTKERNCWNVNRGKDLKRIQIKQLQTALWPAVSESLKDMYWFPRKTASTIWPLKTNNQITLLTLANKLPFPKDSWICFGSFPCEAGDSLHQSTTRNFQSHETLKLMISVKNCTRITTLASCGQIASHKLKASYLVLVKEGSRHQGVLPFSCSFSAWNTRRRLLGGPAAALADESVWATAGWHSHQELGWCFGVHRDLREILDAFGQEWLSCEADCTGWLAGADWVVDVSEGAGQKESR